MQQNHDHFLHLALYFCLFVPCHCWVIIMITITIRSKYPFSCHLVFANFYKRRKIRRQEEVRPFTSYLKYRAAVCFMYKKQDPPFVLWKFTRPEFQSSADKIF